MKNKVVLTIAMVIIMVIAAVPALAIADTSSAQAGDGDKEFVQDMNEALGAIFGKWNGTTSGAVYADYDESGLTDRYVLNLDWKLFNTDNVALQTEDIIGNIEYYFNHPYTIKVKEVGDENWTVFASNGEVSRTVFIKYLLLIIANDFDVDFEIDVSLENSNLTFNAGLIGVDTTGSMYMDELLRCYFKYTEKTATEEAKLRFMFPFPVYGNDTIGSLLDNMKSLTYDRLIPEVIVAGTDTIEPLVAAMNFAEVLNNSSYGDEVGYGLKALEPLKLVFNDNQYLQAKYDKVYAENPIEQLFRSLSFTQESTAVNKPVSYDSFNWQNSSKMYYLDDYFVLDFSIIVLPVHAGAVCDGTCGSIVINADAGNVPVDVWDYLYGGHEIIVSDEFPNYKVFRYYFGANVTVNGDTVTIKDVSGDVITLKAQPNASAAGYTYAFGSWYNDSSSKLKTQDNLISTQFEASMSKTYVNPEGDKTKTEEFIDGTVITTNETANGDASSIAVAPDGTVVESEYKASTKKMETEVPVEVINNSVSVPLSTISKQVDSVSDAADVKINVVVNAVGGSTRQVFMDGTVSALNEMIQSTASNNVSLTLNSDAAVVTMDKKSMQTIANYSDGTETQTFKLSVVKEAVPSETVKDAKVSYDLSVLVNDMVQVHNFRTGSLTFTLPYEVGLNENTKKTHVIHEKNDGTQEKLVCTIDGNTLSFSTNGLSVFSVVPGTSAAPDEGGDDDQGGGESAGGFVLDKNVTVAIAFFVLVLAILALAVTIGKNRR